MTFGPSMHPTANGIQTRSFRDTSRVSDMGIRPGALVCASVPWGLMSHKFAFCCACGALVCALVFLGVSLATLELQHASRDFRVWVLRWLFAFAIGFNKLLLLHVQRRTDQSLA